MVNYANLNPVKEQIKGTQHVIQTIGTYGSVFDPLTQYIANGIDAGATEITIGILPNRHMIIVTDNGEGMTRQKLASIPSSIGESDKTYAPRQPNEHSKIGLHAYGEYAYQTWVGRRTGELVVISRPRGHQTYNVLVRRNEGPREGVIEAQDVEFGAFSSGTRIIVRNVRDDAMDVLKGVNGEKRTKRYLSDLFDICLRKGHVRLFVNGRTPSNLVLPVEYKGDVLLEETLPVEYVDELGQRRDGEVQLYIVGGSDGAGRIRLCLQDVKILGAISEVEQLDYSPFSATVLGGYVNSVDLLWPTGEKHGIQIDENRFPPFKSILDSRKEFLIQQVERLTETRDMSADRIANELLSELFKTDLQLRLAKAPPRGPAKRTHTRRGPRNLRTPLTARLVEFPTHEADMLSKVDSDIVFINKDADEYQEAVTSGQREERRYLLGLLSGEYTFAKLLRIMQGTTVTPDLIHTSREEAYKLFRKASKKLGL